MSDVLAELQRALFAVLKNATAAKKNVFDRVPEKAGFPRITFGPGQVVPDDADCVRSLTVFLQLDVWSRAVGAIEARGIAGEIYALVHDTEPALAGYSWVGPLRIESRRDMGDPDGVTTHVAIMLTGDLEVDG